MNGTRQVVSRLSVRLQQFVATVTRLCSVKIAAIREWRSERRRDRLRFPRRWLTFKKRLQIDVADAFMNSPETFNAKYLETISGTAKQVDTWIISLYIAQTSAIFFLLLGFLSTTGTISIFGVSFQNASG